MSTAIKERPLVCQDWEVLAFLDGRKTQFRRLVKPQPTSPAAIADFLWHGDRSFCIWPTDEPDEDGVHQDHYAICPYGARGSHLWVRETWAQGESAPYADGQSDLVTYFRADITEGRDEISWRPSTQMPRSASRITLEIVSVRLERLQDISENDAIAEGLYAYNFTGWGDEPGLPSFPEPTVYRASKDRDWTEYAVGEYRWLWESFNGAGSWDVNPWVWALDVRCVEEKSKK